MKPILEIHPIQVSILRSLIFTPEARFAKLNEFKLSSDQFTFHLKSLIKAGLLERPASGRYKLTDRGKEFTNRFDSKGVLICCVRQEGKQRLKQPYYRILWLPHRESENWRNSGRDRQKRT